MCVGTMCMIRVHVHVLVIGGEMFAWGTNSMGQCGQGHNNGSITTPAKVQGLEGIQVQQISAGTSHSIAWTAMSINRYLCDYLRIIIIICIYSDQIQYGQLHVYSRV